MSILHGLKHCHTEIVNLWLIFATLETFIYRPKLGEYFTLLGLTFHHLKVCELEKVFDLGRKELSLCHKIKLSNPCFFAT